MLALVYSLSALALLAASSPAPTAGQAKRQLLPTGILPSGILPSGILPSSILPSVPLPDPSSATPSGILPSSIGLPTGILPSTIGLPIPSVSVPDLPLPTGGNTDNTCTTGPIQCCQSIEPASSLTDDIIALLNTEGIQITDVSIPIGQDCIPVNVISGCSAMPACCENSTVTGVVAINCIVL